jgi:hypothetical protein
MNRISWLTPVLVAILLTGCAHKNLKPTDPKASATTDAEKYPFLTRPEVRTLWIPDTVEGNRYIERHRVFVIEKNSTWSKDND